MIDPYQLRLAHALYRLWRLRRFRRRAERERILYGPLPGPKYPPQRRAASSIPEWRPDLMPGWVHSPDKAGYDTPDGFVPYERLLRR